MPCSHARCDMKRVDDVGQRLQELSRSVHEATRDALDAVVDQFLQSNEIVADHRMTFMERTSLRSQCRRLTRFLRMVDFLIMDTLRRLVTTSDRNGTCRAQTLSRAVLCDDMLRLPCLTRCCMVSDRCRCLPTGTSSEGRQKSVPPTGEAI